jgi:hypothetical protein
MWLVILPFAHIITAINECESALAMVLVVSPFPHVFSAIGEGNHTGAVGLSALKFTDKR